jgi:hypothetical protein
MVRGALHSGHRDRAVIVRLSDRSFAGSNPDYRRVGSVIDYIEAHLAAELSPATLTEVTHFSPPIARQKVVTHQSSHVV